MTRANLITNDNYAQLAANIVIQGVKDLFDDQMIKSVDALLWWLDPGGGRLWVDCLGDFVEDPDRVFTLVCLGGKHAKKAITGGG